MKRTKRCKCQNKPNGEAVHLSEFPDPKAFGPQKEDLSKGSLEAIDMDSYRNEVRETLELALPDQDGEIYSFLSDLNL